MTERILGPVGKARTTFAPGGSGRRWWTLTSIVMAALMFAVVFVAGSGATTAVGTAPRTCTPVPSGSTNTLNANSVDGGYSNFEIDAASVGGTAKKPVNTLGANLTLDGSSPCLDWTTKGPGAGSGVAADLTSGVLVKPDKPTGTGDDSFTQGTSEGSTTPTIATGSIPPNKSDLKQFGIYKESNATGKFLNLFWTRVNAPSGTVDMDFELNKLSCDGTATMCSDNSPSNQPASYVTPLRSQGDRLITYDLASGGTVPTISIYTWTGNATSGSWTGQQVISGAGGEALGSINWSAIASGDSGGIGAQDPLTFGEVSISYKAIFGSGGTTGCGTFGSVYLKSRSSNTFTDELKDFVAPENVQITNCASLTTNASNQVTAQTLSATNTISDTATLSGASGATGKVVFTAYGPFDANSVASGDTCTATTQAFTDGTAGVSLTGPDASGNYSATDSFLPTSAGRYEWIASYGGDPNNIAGPTGCKDANEFSLVKETPGLGTTLSTTSAINPGQTAHDSSALTWNSTPIPTGSVTYTIYSENTCTTAATTGTGGMIDAQPAQVTVNANGSVPNSGDVTFNLTGIYYWQASYSGDSNYATQKSPCLSEQLVVNQLNSTISTAQSWRPQDTATIDHSGGSVVFTLYKNDATCSDATKIAFGPTGSISVTGQGAGGTAPFQASTSNSTFSVTATGLAGDTYYWKAAYTSGDTSHKNVTSCVESTMLTLANGSSVTSQ
jgi:hypothetical protein